MSDQSNRGGPNLGLLLIIPAAAIVARAAMRHHQMLWDEGADAGPAERHGGHGHHGGYGHHGPARFGPGGPRGDFRLPPRLVAMLDAWHAQAHEADDARDDLRA